MSATLVRITNNDRWAGSLAVYRERLDDKGQWVREPSAVPPVFLGHPTAETVALVDNDVRLVIERENAGGRHQDQVLLKLADLSARIDALAELLRRPAPSGES